MFFLQFGTFLLSFTSASRHCLRPTRLPMAAIWLGRYTVADSSPIMLESTTVSMDFPSAAECGCEPASRPVCGSDGLTYDNECLLHCARRDPLRRKVSLHYRGTCCRSARECPTNVHRVCDENGMIYENECIFVHHQCITERTGRGRLQMAKLDSHGHCPFVGSENDIYGVLDDEGDYVDSWEMAEEVPDENNASIGPVPIATIVNGSSTISDREVKAAHGNIASQPAHSEVDRSPDEDGTIIHWRYIMARFGSKTPDAIAPSQTQWKLNDFPKRQLGSLTHASTQPYAIDSAPLQVASDNPSQLQEEKAEIVLERGEDVFAANGTTALPSLHETPVMRVHGAEIYDEQRGAQNNYDGALQTAKANIGSAPTAALPIEVLPALEEPVELDCDHLCGNEADVRGAKKRELSNNQLYHGEALVPICDNANRTHQSICLFAQWNCDRLRVGGEERVLVHIGACHSQSPTFDLELEECPNKCSRHYKPVCDTLGLTHPNLCTFQMHNCYRRKAWKAALRNNGTSEGRPNRPGWLRSLRACKKTEGDRDGDSRSIRRSSVIRPSAVTKSDKFATCPIWECPKRGEGGGKGLCDNEGQYHPDECHFSNARCAAAKGGRPQLSIIGETTIGPDDCLYKSRGTLPSTQLTAASPPSLRCQQHEAMANCSRFYEPYCGSNFVTYQNLCHFRKQRCGGGGLAEANNSTPPLEILFKGECSLCFNRTCPIFEEASNSSENKLFVCDQDGETRSRCEFEILRCVYRQKFNETISIAHEGRCCPREEDCISPHGGAHSTKISSDSTINAEAEVKVCDSRGHTYPDSCAFNAAKCRVERVENGTLEGYLCRHSIDSKGRTHHEKKEKQKVLQQSQPKTASLASHQGLPHRQSELYDLVAESGGIHEPVCGSDHHTYANLGHLRNSGRNGLLGRLSSGQHGSRSASTIGPTLLYKGKCCPTEDTCSTFDYSPVCDSHGDTHLNLCFFGRARCLAARMHGLNLTLAAYGLCQLEKNPCKVECPHVYEPVCGTDGRTHASECELERAACLFNLTNGGHTTPLKNLRLDYNGTCCENSHCPLRIEPVCDNLGQTHMNRCFFDAAACVTQRRRGINMRIFHGGECCDSSNCTTHYQPVCDGQKTHLNECHFKARQCDLGRIGQSLQLRYRGECCSLPRNNCERSGPLCDSTGETLLDACHFELKRCIAERIRNETLTVLHAGECCRMAFTCPPPSGNATGEEAICDNRGVTHLSACHFHQVKCREERHFNNSRSGGMAASDSSPNANTLSKERTSLAIRHKGVCCPTNCTVSSEDSGEDKICDQHGRVYAGECAFAVAQCEETRLGSRSELESGLFVALGRKPCEEKKIP